MSYRGGTNFLTVKKCKCERWAEKKRRLFVLLLLKALSKSSVFVIQVWRFQRRIFSSKKTLRLLHSEAHWFTVFRSVLSLICSTYGLHTHYMYYVCLLYIACCRRSSLDVMILSPGYIYVLNVLCSNYRAMSA